MKKTVGFIFVLAIVIICARNVSGAKYPTDEMLELRKSTERDFVRGMRGYLKELNYNNSGVTLTKTTEDELEWSYRVVISNGGFKYADGTERKELVNAVTAYCNSPDYKLMFGEEMQSGSVAFSNEGYIIIE